jgi:hypothetical protein
MSFERNVHFQLQTMSVYTDSWKRRVQQFFYCCVCIRYRGNFSTDLLPSNYKRIFTELSRYPATIRDTHTKHRLIGGIFNSVVEMSSGAVIYASSFIKIDSGVQRLLGGYTDRHTYTHGHQHDLISLLYFFQNKKSRLKILEALLIIWRFNSTLNFTLILDLSFKRLWENNCLNNQFCDIYERCKIVEASIERVSNICHIIMHINTYKCSSENTVLPKRNWNIYHVHVLFIVFGALQMQASPLLNISLWINFPPVSHTNISHNHMKHIEFRVHNSIGILLHDLSTCMLQIFIEAVLSSSGLYNDARGSFHHSKRFHNSVE